MTVIFERAGVDGVSSAWAAIGGLNSFRFYTPHNPRRFWDARINMELCISLGLLLYIEVAK